MPITIKPVEDDLDLFCKYQGQHDWQPAFIKIDPETEIISAGYDANIGGGMTFDVYHRRVLQYSIPPVRAGEANELMESIKPLTERIIAGHSTRWDGNNYVGRLDEDAGAAEEELEYQLSQFCPSENGGAWEACDWFQDADSAELGVAAKMTDGELGELAKGLFDHAKSEGIAIYGGVGAIELVLERRRQWLLDELDEDEEEAA